jgi:aspartate/methionine/tyrosine aminotransferase
VEQHVTQVRDTLRDRRDRLVTSLRAAGLETFVEPGGSLFLLLRLPGVEDDMAFCHRLLEEQHVVAVPGSAFGPGGEGSIRLSFGATPPARLDEVVHRIVALL